MNIPYRRFPRPLLGIFLGCALAFTGCATTDGPKTDFVKGGPPQPVQTAAPEKQETTPAEQLVSVESISVVGEGDRVLIDTQGKVRYTVFRLSSPSRLIVDMPGVSLEKVVGDLPVNNDFITGIEVVSYGGEDNIGRITIGLREGIDHDVKSGGDSILVSLAKDVFISGFTAESEAAVVKASVKGGAAEAAGAPADSAEAELEAVSESLDAAVGSEIPSVAEVERAVAESSRPATMLVSVNAENLGSSTIVTITADGAVGNYDAFELDEPARLVVDVWGVDNSLSRSTMDVDSEDLKGVRIGRHPDKTRIVFDSNLPAPPEHAIEKSGDKLVVTFGQKAAESKTAPAEPVRMAKAVEDVSSPVARTMTVDVPAEAEPRTPAWEAAAEAAPAPEMTAAEEAAPAEVVPVQPAAPAQAPSPMKVEAPAMASAPEPVMAEAKATVTGVDFRKMPDMATLTITATGETDYSVNESADGATIAIDIADATIPDHLKMTLDATKLGTPVQTISSYQASFAPDRTVRVLVKLSDKAEYRTTEQGGVLKLLFPPAVAMVGEDGVITDETVAAMEAAAELFGEDKTYTGTKISLDMTNANISDILRLMAEVSDLNIIASDDVVGTISLRLKDVPWDQAFDIILKAKGLDKIREGNVVRVAPIETIRQERESAIAAVKAEEKLEDTMLEFIPVNYANAADLVVHVENVLTERGSVTSEERTNTLIIKDITKGIESARGLITKLDTAIPQVLIEARIVEATSSFARDLGVQWGAEFETGGNVSTNTFGSTTDTTFPGSEKNNSNVTVPSSFAATTTSQENFAVNLPASGTAGTLGALGFIFGKMGQNPLILDLRLSAGEQEGELKTISRPKITTLDNKEAKIEQGESIPFETTSASGTATTFIDANLSLTVTPHITPDGSVLMKIKASRNSIGTFRTSSGEPSINKKEASTEVLVKDGETTVIGGIVVTDNNDTDKGIPFLKDIPLLGWLFKSKSISDSQTELLIFLTPTIIKDQTLG